MFYRLFFLIFCVQVLIGNPTKVSEIVSRIPESDRVDLERFFQLLIRKELLGYTLFGEKPISGAAFFGLQDCDALHQKKYIILEKGWRAWIRNKHLISDEYFFLKRRKHRILSFHLINKKKTLETLQKNLDCIGDLTPEEVLTEICSDRPNFEVLGSQSLIGILYGYGKQNASLFEKQTELLQSLSSKMAPPFSREVVASRLSHSLKFFLEILAKRRRFGKPSYNLSQIDALNQLVDQQKTFSLREEAPFIKEYATPGFVSWDEEESQQLKDLYEKTLARMKEVYKGGGFLEKTLQQWIYPQ